LFVDRRWSVALWVGDGRVFFCCCCLFEDNLLCYGIVLVVFSVSVVCDPVACVDKWWRWMAEWVILKKCVSCCG